MENKCYRYGKRFNAMVFISLLLNECAVFVFYFIYRYVFEAYGMMLVVLFLAIGLLIGFLTVRIGRTVRESLCYEITDDALVVKEGSRTRRLTWRSFSSADVKSVNLFDRYPVFFTVDSEHLELSQYVDNVAGLGYDIMCRIKDHADVTDRFRTLTEALKEP